MMHIEFYFNANDVLFTTQQLIIKLLNHTEKNSPYTCIITADIATLSVLDTHLWSFDTDSFIPHLLLTEQDCLFENFSESKRNLITNTPILLLPNELNALNKFNTQFLSKYPYLIINIGINTPIDCTAFIPFKRLIEIIGTQEAIKEKGRERFIFYKKNGYTIHHFDLNTHIL